MHLFLGVRQAPLHSLYITKDHFHVDCQNQPRNLIAAHNLKVIKGK
jgi:hypothetical protein